MAGNSKKAEVEADKRLEQYLDVIAKGELPHEAIAALAEVTVADVARFVARLTPDEPPARDAPVPDGLQARLDVREDELLRLSQMLSEQERMLEQREAALEKREAALRALEASVARAMPSPGARGSLRIRLLEAFTAPGLMAGGKLGRQYFGPSVYRGNMAQLVLQRAEEQGKTHLIEIMPEE